MQFNLLSLINPTLITLKIENCVYWGNTQCCQNFYCFLPHHHSTKYPIFCPFYLFVLQVIFFLNCNYNVVMVFKGICTLWISVKDIHVLWKTCFSHGRKRMEINVCITTMMIYCLRVMFMILMSSYGFSVFGCTFVSLIFWHTSMPLRTRPKTVCLLSSHGYKKKKIHRINK